MRKKLGKTSNDKLQRRQRRKLSIRKTVTGTVDRPRVCINKTNKNIYVQVVDDSSSTTILSAQTYGKNAVGSGANKSSGDLIGSELAKKLTDKKIDTIVFDRNGLKFCGVVASVADAMRKSGIKF